MPDVVEIVLELFHCVLVTLAIRIIHLGPPSDSRLNQMPKMIKWDRLLISFGTLTPLWPWTNQANVSFERIPKLRHLIEPKFPQPTPHRRDPTIIFSGVNVFLGVIRARAHRSEFEKNESPPVATDSLLPEKNRTAILYPYEQRHKDEEGRANDQRCCRRYEVEEPFEIMIRRGASQLKTTLERPKRIDDAQRQIAPLSFVKRFQRVNARFLKLCVYQA